MMNKLSNSLSVTSTSSTEEEDRRMANSMLEATEETVRELKLSNVRFEEAFKTHIKKEDIEDET